MGLDKLHKKIVAVLVIVGVLALVAFMLILLHWFDVGSDHLSKSDVNSLIDQRLAARYGIPANLLEILNNAGYTDLGDFFTRMGDIFSTLENVDLDEWNTLIENLGELVNRRVFHAKHTVPLDILTDTTHTPITLPEAIPATGGFEMEWWGSNLAAGGTISVQLTGLGGTPANVATNIVGGSILFWRILLHVIKEGSNKCNTVIQAWTVGGTGVMGAYNQAGSITTNMDVPIVVDLNTSGVSCDVVVSKGTLMFPAA